LSCPVRVLREVAEVSIRYRMTLLRDESKNSGLDFFLSSVGVGAESDVCMYLFFLIHFSTKNRDFKSWYANDICEIVAPYITGF